ncbi:MAG: hypothetical protein ACRCYY_14290 [Trueperaceae bacterium]
MFNHVIENCVESAPVVLTIVPKRFALLPSSEGVFEVNVSAQCVGYVWTDDNQWLAKDRTGQHLGGNVTLHEAVRAVFQTCAVA